MAKNFVVITKIPCYDNAKANDIFRWTLYTLPSLTGRSARTICSYSSEIRLLNLNTLNIAGKKEDAGLRLWKRSIFKGCEFSRVLV